MAIAEQLVTQNDVSQFYIGYLNDAVTIFEDTISYLNNTNDSNFDVYEAADMAHRIKGNAAMYGHASLGLSAGQTEKVLKSETAKTDSDSALLALNTLIDKIQVICLGEGKADSFGAPEFLAVEDVNETEVSQSASTCFDRKIVLFAYKDEWISQLVASMLEPEFKVISAGSGAQLLEAVDTYSPQLVILEDSLGDMEGLDVVKTLRASERHRGLNIYVAFNPNSHELIAEAIGLGVDGFAEDKHNILEITDFARKALRTPSKSVLVVDDDPMVRDLLDYSLSSAGFKVNTACDGLEALTYLATKSPDLILLDRFMPRLEGGTVLYEIQNKINLKSIPVLILTAMDNQGEAKSWFERGAADFIPKPFDPAEVLMRVKQHLNTSQRAL